MQIWQKSRMSNGAYIMGDFFHFHSPLYHQPKNSHIFDHYNGGQKLVQKTEKLGKMKKIGYSSINLQITPCFPIFLGEGGAF